MKVCIIGSHGIPARHGGFETFASHLALACAEAGIEVTVVNEKNNPVEDIHSNIRLISSKYNKSEQPLKYYRDSLRLAAGNDIILCCGVGGALYYKSSKLPFTKIITNIDGLEHRRKKYSVLQRLFVYYLQGIANKRSDYLIADCVEIWGYWNNRFPGNSQSLKMIGYGADDPFPFDAAIVENYGLKQNEYFLAIARIVPENNLEEIIDAYNHYLGHKKLVIVGNLGNDKYSRKLKQISSVNVLFTGAIYDKRILDSLRKGCFIYLHGHSVGGANPSLIEAMAAGCACICHENVFNREVTAGTQMFFDAAFDLAIMMNILEHKASEIDSFKEKSLKRIREKYSWVRNCSLYIELFKRISVGIKIKVPVRHE